jgi:hypothetical protein
MLGGQDLIQPSVALGSSFEYRRDSEIIFARIDGLALCQPCGGVRDVPVPITTIAIGRISLHHIDRMSR